MRLSLLKTLVLNQMRSVMKEEKPLCMTVNMDEDISAGACRMSHLFVDHRLQIDSRLQNKAVFQDLSSSDSVFVDDAQNSDKYFITCSDSYLTGIEKNRWHSLDEITDKEESQMKDSRVKEWIGYVVICRDVDRLLNRTKENESTNSRISKARSEAEAKLYSIKTQLTNAPPSPEVDNALKSVRLLLARVSRTNTFATTESTERLMKDIQSLDNETHSLRESASSSSRNSPRSSTEIKSLMSTSPTQPQRDYLLNTYSGRNSARFTFSQHENGLSMKQGGYSGLVDGNGLTQMNEPRQSEIVNRDIPNIADIMNSPQHRLLSRNQISDTLPTGYQSTYSPLVPPTPIPPIPPVSENLPVPPTPPIPRTPPVSKSLSVSQTPPVPPTLPVPPIPKKPLPPKLPDQKAGKENLSQSTQMNPKRESVAATVVSAESRPTSVVMPSNNRSSSSPLGITKSDSGAHSHSNYLSRPGSPPPPRPGSPKPLNSPSLRPRSPPPLPPPRSGSPRPPNSPLRLGSRSGSPPPNAPTKNQGPIKRKNTDPVEAVSDGGSPEPNGDMVDFSSSIPKPLSSGDNQHENEARQYDAECKQRIIASSNLQAKGDDMSPVLSPSLTPASVPASVAPPNPPAPASVPVPLPAPVPPVVPIPTPLTPPAIPSVPASVPAPPAPVVLTSNPPSVPVILTPASEPVPTSEPAPAPAPASEPTSAPAPTPEYSPIPAPGNQGKSKSFVSVLSAPMDKNTESNTYNHEADKNVVNEEIQSADKEISLHSDETPSKLNQSSIENLNVVPEQSPVKEQTPVEQSPIKIQPVEQSPANKQTAAITQEDTPPEVVYDEDQKLEKEKEENIRKGCGCCRRKTFL